MENKELAEQLRIAAEILETGKEWEIKTATGDWVCDYDESPLFWINSSRPIRIKPWSLPAPTEGQEWHRASEWKEGMLDEGERPLIEGEVIERCDLFMEENGVFSKFGSYSNGRTVDLTYHLIKTSRPLPQKKTKKIIPLGPEDVPMGSYLRFKTAPNCSWRSVGGVSKNGVASVEMMSDNTTHIKFCLWEELKESYLIKRPTDSDFVPAHKEVEE